MGHDRSHARGFALLLTLAILSIAAVALASIGRRSFRVALSAQHAQLDLQRQWGQRSLEDTLLPQLSKLLNPPAPAKSERAAQSPAHSDDSLALVQRQAQLDAMRVAPRRLRMTLELGSLHGVVEIADEQTKLNANALASTPSIEKVTADLHRVLTAKGWGIEIAPQPLGDFHRKLNALDKTWPAFVSYEQLVAVPGEMMSSARAVQRLGPVRECITLWGDGRLHVRHASPEALEVGLGSDIAAVDVQRLVALRTEHPDASLDELLDMLKLKSRQRKQLATKLTDVSRCQSLTIQLSSRQRTWERLVITEHQPGNNASQAPPVVQRLEW